MVRYLPAHGNLLQGCHFGPIECLSVFIRDSSVVNFCFPRIDRMSRFGFVEQHAWRLLIFLVTPQFTSPPGWCSRDFSEPGPLPLEEPRLCITCINCIRTIHRNQLRNNNLTQKSMPEKNSLHMHKRLSPSVILPPSSIHHPLLTSPAAPRIPPPPRDCSPKVGPPGPWRTGRAEQPSIGDAARRKPWAAFCE
jgi:hypothetical protein